MSYWPRNFDRPQWDFAKQLGVESLIGEPKEDRFDAIEKLCDEYGLKFAIHNHPKSQSHYWNPDTVLKVCRGRSTASAPAATRATGCDRASIRWRR